tara:strand:- start:768 stop:1013 length:246 start_codon:yes stop_codon:yes gene_type:complete
MDELEGLIPVEGKEGLYRDPYSNAIIKSSADEYDKYMASYNKRQKEARDKQALQNEVSELKSEMSEIKSLLLTLVQDKNDR